MRIEIEVIPPPPHGLGFYVPAYLSVGDDILVVILQLIH